MRQLELTYKSCRCASPKCSDCHWGSAPCSVYKVKKNIYCLEGTFFFGSVVTEVSKNQEKVLRKRSAKEELFWYCSCLNWTVRCPDHHSWHAAIQNHSVLLPLTSTINYFFYMHQWRGNLEYCSYDVWHKFLQKKKSFCSWPRERIFIQKNNIVNSSDSSPWTDKAPIFSPLGCACLCMQHHWCTTNLKYLPPPQCMYKLSHHFLLLCLWPSVQL